MNAPNFGEMFMAAKSGQISYRDRTLVLSDSVPAQLGQRFSVTIESTNARFPQGVGVSTDVAVFGEAVPRAVVWEYFSVPPAERTFRRSQLPFMFEVECRSPTGELSFYNMAELDGGKQSWWHGGSCMWVEPIAHGRRYHCNDFELDDDFDDIIFTVTWRDA